MTDYVLNDSESEGDLSDSESDDLMTGCPAIAEWMFGDRLQKRRVYHLYETTDIPIFKVKDGPRNLWARKTALRKWLSEKEQRAVAERTALIAERANGAGN